MGGSGLNGRPGHEAGEHVQPQRFAERMPILGGAPLLLLPRCIRPLQAEYLGLSFQDPDPFIAFPNTFTRTLRTPGCGLPGGHWSLRS